METKLVEASKNNQPTSIITDRQSDCQILKDVTSNFISSLSGGMLSLAMGLMLLHDTHSPLSFGLETAIVPIVSLLFLVPVGNIVDHFRHKVILVTSLSFRLGGLLMFALSLPHFNGADEFAPVIGFVIVNAISTNFSTTAYTAAVHELVNEQKIQILGALTQAASSLSSILAPVVGVILYTMMGFELLIMVEIISTIIALLILISMHFHYQNSKSCIGDDLKKRVSQLTHFKVGLNYIKSRPLIRDLIFMAIVVNLLFTAVTIGLPFVITNQLHAGNQPVGVIETGFSLGLLVGSLLMSMIPNKKYLSVKVLLPTTTMGLCIILLGMTLTVLNQPNQLSIVGAMMMLVAGLMSATMNITINVLLQTTVPERLLGRVSAILTTSVTAIMPIGTLIYTVIFQLNLKGALVIVMSGCLMFAYGLGFVKRLFEDIRRDYLFKKD
ncbi:MFS transporter [Lentilactobacillus raoultii]|uniref:MFS transporter n=1 Tax=Lentilactobacillus raoultii TaxID=1987503 RepID=A0ABW3PJ30_9LACO|nr:MFS transporter [Lentilactobacillus raoultii]